MSTSNNFINFKAEAEALHEQLIAWRRDFHMHPELGFQEHRSAAIVAEYLRQLGYDVQTGIAHTGVVGLLEGEKGGPVVMARFDMDALPVTELNEVDYASRNPGIMHACGHDAHMAMGLGVATLLAKYRDQITGTLKLVFQPGEEGGPVVMARFDMDALPVTELNEVDYASRNPGIMHACGHDAHMAMGLGVATLLAKYRDQITGTLKLVFQPGEEGMNGAEVMVKEGVMENPHPDVVLATHVWIEKPIGTIAVTSGAVMAAAEKWTCVVRGEGGHGALPHQAVDPIVAASHIVTALQTIVSRDVSPLSTAVVTVGSIEGGDAFNVIPEKVEMSGTIRTYDPQVRETVLRRVREVFDGVSAACGTEAELEFSCLTPALVNDPQVSKVVRSVAESVVGPDNVSVGDRTMGSEDAAFFLQEAPGCYFFLGAANAERGLDAPHHNPHFDFDEDALPLGVAVMAKSIAHYLI